MKNSCMWPKTVYACHRKDVVQGLCLPLLCTTLHCTPDLRYSFDLQVGCGDGQLYCHVVVSSCWYVCCDLAPSVPPSLTPTPTPLNS